MFKKIWLRFKSHFGLDQEGKVVEKPIGKPLEHSQDEASTSGASIGRTDLDSMTKKELMDIARDTKLKGRSTMNKAELLQALREKRRNG